MRVQLSVCVCVCVCATCVCVSSALGPRLIARVGQHQTERIQVSPGTECSSSCSESQFEICPNVQRTPLPPCHLPLLVRVFIPLAPSKHSSSTTDTALRLRLRLRLWLRLRLINCGVYFNIANSLVLIYANSLTTPIPSPFHPPAPGSQLHGTCIMKCIRIASGESEHLLSVYRALRSRVD